MMEISFLTKMDSCAISQFNLHFYLLLVDMARDPNSYLCSRLSQVNSSHSLAGLYMMTNYWGQLYTQTFEIVYSSIVYTILLVLAFLRDESRFHLPRMYVVIAISYRICSL